MDKSTAIGITVAMGLILWLMSNADSADMSSSDIVAPDNSITGETELPPLSVDPSSASQDQLINATLAVIRQFESGGDYNVLYGAGRVAGFPSHFSDMSRHPNVRVPINLPGYEGKVSTAAGAYQINYPTYKDFAGRLGLSDFSASTQDALARAILIDTGAVPYLLHGDVQTALQRASRRWASLPGSTAGQHPTTLASALDVFSNFLATV